MQQYAVPSILSGCQSDPASSAHRASSRFSTTPQDAFKPVGYGRVHSEWQPLMRQCQLILSIFNTTGLHSICVRASLVPRLVGPFSLFGDVLLSIQLCWLHLSWMTPLWFCAVQRNKHKSIAKAQIVILTSGSIGLSYIVPIFNTLCSNTTDQHTIPVLLCCSTLIQPKFLTSMLCYPLCWFPCLLLGIEHMLSEPKAWHAVWVCYIVSVGRLWYNKQVYLSHA